MFSIIQKPIASIFWVTLICITAAACRQKPKFVNKPHFNQHHAAYISAYTTGQINRNGSVQITFTSDVAPLPHTRAEFENDNIITTKPQVKGKLRWLDYRTLEFTPDKMFESTQVFDAKLDLKKLFDTVSPELRFFPFQFNTPAQRFAIQKQELEPAFANSKLMRLTGEISLQDYEDDSKVEQLLKAEWAGRQLKVKWRHYNYSTTHYFEADSIVRSNVADSVKLSWNGAPVKYDYTSVKFIKIPSLSDFSITGISNTSNPEASIKLQFSDPVDPSQDLNGLITSAGASFRFDVNGGEITAYPDVQLQGNVKLNVSAGIRNIWGYKLNKSAEYDVHFEEIKPQLRAVGAGNIIPQANGRIPFPFEAVNLAAVDVRIIKVYENNVLQFMQNRSLDDRSEYGSWENYYNLHYVGKVIYEKKIPLQTSEKINLRSWNRHALDLSKLVKTEPGAIYNVSIRFRREYSIYACSEKYIPREEENDVIIRSSPKTLWDYYDTYYYDESSNGDDACADYYYRQNKGITRNILASDLGIIAKRGEDGDMLLAVNSLLTTQPVKNVSLEVYNFQQQKLITAATNDNGLAQFRLNEEPFVVVAKSGSQRGYLRMISSPLSLSRFDVGGAGHKKGVNGFIYGDRGVWRPGDSIFITFLLQDKMRALPAKHPIIFEMYNPAGQLVQKQVKTSSVNGFYTFPTATTLNAPTGNYEVQVNVGGAVFSKTIKVETIIPNRLKLKLAFRHDHVTAKDSALAVMHVNWLHGALAKSFPVEITAGLRKKENPFPAYKDYIFHEPNLEAVTDAGIITAGNLDENGTIHIPNKIKITQASGPLLLKLYGKVTEPGGRFSTDNFSAIYHPYQKYLGLRVPAGYGEPGILLTNRSHNFDIVQLDVNGKPADGKIAVKLYRLQWRWWYDYYDEGDENSYNSRQTEELVKADTILVKNGKAQWKLKMQPNESGRYFLQVVNMDGHATGKVIFVDNEDWYRRVRDDDEAAGTTMLSFSSAKKQYRAGETASINIPAGYNGMALVTVENALRVLKAEWITTTEKNTRYAFTVLPEMAPNVYVSVTLMQPHAGTQNDLPMRLFGVIPVVVDDPASHLKPVALLPDVIKPESTVNMLVSEQNGRSMTYTIAMVDEGLLDLTRFRTPDPWQHFNEKQALQVKTWDIYDLVLGNHISKLKKMLSVGGDEYNRSGDATRLQRFKPMVRFMGPFTLAAGKSASHKINIPQYIGSVRTMIIAADELAYGTFEITTPVRSPLMVLGTLPRVLRPNEEVNLPVTVFAMEDFVKDVKIDVQVNDVLTVKGAATQHIKFAEKGEQLLNFPLLVKPGVGIANVEITATSGRQKAKYNIALQVHAPNPVTYRNEETVVLKGNSAIMNYAAFGINGTNKGSIELSAIPTINLSKRLDYLIQYPHGCIEQTTSTVFPQLFVDKMLQLPEAKKKEIEKNIKSAISRLRTFQLPGGGMSYWPNETGDAVSEWGTNYAGHFLLEAESFGYQVPAELLEKWYQFQKEAANNHLIHSADEALTQAYRLYLLALMRKPETGAMNRLMEERNMPATVKWLLAAAYFKSGQKTLAQKLIKGLPIQVNTYRELSNTYGSDFRDKAIILEVLTQMNQTAEAITLTRQLSDILKTDRWLSTQETAYALLAIAKSGFTNGKNALNISYRFDDGKWQTLSSDKPMVALRLELDKKPGGKLEIRNNGNGMCYVNLALQGVAEAGKEVSENKNISLKINYTDRQGKPVDVTKLEQGTDFIAEIHVSNTGKYQQVDELALTALFPSGWQIYNPRLAEGEFTVASSRPEYMDVRDDRVYLYFDLTQSSSGNYNADDNRSPEDRSNSKIFRIGLNASYTGKFYLPSVSCEAMYDKNIRANVPGKWVQVVKQNNRISANSNL